MDDRLIMDNYLLVLKSTVEVYVHGTLESSNKDIRKLLLNNLNETLSMQANTYDEMVKFNWYPTNNIKKSAISEALSKIKKKS